MIMGQPNHTLRSASLGTISGSQMRMAMMALTALLIANATPALALSPGSSLASIPTTATASDASEAMMTMGAMKDPKSPSQRYLRTQTSALFQSPGRTQQDAHARRSLSALSARYRRPYEDEDDRYDGYSSGMQRQRQVRPDRPTATMMHFDRPPVSPAKPKIVVLGATGRIGRLIVKQLLSMDMDMTIVALARNYDKAIKVLSDDLLVSNQRRRGPKLQIVQGDLVPPEELPGYADYDPEEEAAWMENADSASKFYGTQRAEYDNREMMPDVNEALEFAIKDCTTIISSVGSCRPTNLWTDYLARPFLRVFRKDVSKWCKDGRHPYYVHYASTRKALGYAEREQLRREAAAAVIAEEDHLEVDEYTVPRIRFIRISDLSVAHRPWHLVPLVTNMVQSLSIRYHEMAEQLLEQSTVLETVLLRAGDIVDDERNVNTTSVQVSHSGKVSSPSRISREDVASVAIASVLFQSSNETLLDKFEPFHYMFGVRWVGEDLHPYPAQGKRTDGTKDARLAFTKALLRLHKESHRNNRRDTLMRRRRQLYMNARDDDDYDAYFSDVILRLKNKMEASKRQLQPHGLCASIPIYILFAMCMHAVMRPLLQFVPGYQTHVIPALGRAGDSLLLRMTTLAQGLVQHLPKFARRKLHYISI